MISTNQSALIPSVFSRHATQQKNVMKPKYASYSVAHAQTFPVNEACQIGTCKLVRAVITTMNKKINPNRHFKKSFKGASRRILLLSAGFGNRIRQSKRGTRHVPRLDERKSMPLRAIRD